MAIRDQRETPSTKENKSYQLLREKYLLFRGSCCLSLPPVSGAFLDYLECSQTMCCLAKSYFLLQSYWLAAGHEGDFRYFSLQFFWGGCHLSLYTVAATLKEGILT